MLTFGLIVLLGTAQADTPKKKTDKTEESKTTKDSSTTSHPRHHQRKSRPSHPKEKHNDEANDVKINKYQIRTQE